MVGQPGVIVLGGQNLSNAGFVRTSVAVPSVTMPLAVTPMPMLAAVDGQLTQLYSRSLAQPVMQMLPELQERQVGMNTEHKEFNSLYFVFCLGLLLP